VGISKLKIKILQRKESFQLRKEFKKMVSLYQVGAVDMDKLFLVFMEIYRQEEEALEVARKRIATNQLERMDIERNIIFRGFLDGVKSSGNCIDADVQQSFSRLNGLLGRYENITRRACYKKTSGFYNLTQEITSLYIADVDLLGLAPWILQLDSANRAVDLLSKLHYDKVAAKTGLMRKQVQRQIEAACQHKADQLNAQIRLKVAIKFAVFVKCMDARMESYYNIIEQRRGKALQKDNKCCEIIHRN
jgi:hypothetical protein